ncbi:MAG TPA: T9SS type A sorting domain-containing protein [Saprospiraceae bacterium]|nr:T9SS type A sorting domain-containing protein [Saprospiraceae bacterium]HQW56453.1 T9SS type A sorting domain-containing protein [Saprospiraceae bacterium]
MKNIILIAVSLFLWSSISAQVFRFETDTLRTTVNLEESEAHLENNAINTTDVPQVLRWTSKILFKPVQWEGVQVCDIVNCYLPIITTRIVTIPANGKTFLKCSMWPNGVDSCALVSMTIKLEGATDDDDTAYYFYESPTNSCFALSNKLISKVEEVKAFPNPATSMIALNNLEPLYNLRIINQTGAVVNRVDQYNKQPLDISNLTGGVYYIIYEYRDGSLGMSRFIKY